MPTSKIWEHREVKNCAFLRENSRDISGKVICDMVAKNK